MPPDNPVTKVEVLRNQDDPKKFLLTIEVEGSSREEAVKITLARIERLRQCGLRVSATVVECSENAR